MEEDKFVDLELGGRPYRLAFDFNELAEAEKLTGLNLLAGIGSGGSAGQVRGVLFAALKPHNPKVTLDEAGLLLTKDLTGVMRAIRRLFGAGDAEAPEAEKPAAE